MWQRRDAPCAGVDGQVELSVVGQGANVVFRSVPVASIEGLPLGSSVYEVEGESLLRAVNEVRFSCL